MNYLAHIFLADGHPEAMLGNFIADGLKRKEFDMLPEDIKRGVLHHRRLDKVTDGHPAFKHASRSLRKRHDKYAPVVLDILNDHLLSLNWNIYTDKSFEVFENEVYDEFSKTLNALPPNARKRTEILIEYQYLKAYRSKQGMEGVLRRMDKRTKFNSCFVLGIEDLYTDLDFYNSCFLQLFNDLKEVKLSSF